MKTISVSLFVLVVFMSLFSCGSGGNENTESDNASFETTLIIQDSSGTEQEIFNTGEDILLTLEIQNTTQKDQYLNFSSSKIYDIEMFDSNDNLIWNWAHGKAFTAAITELHFSAQEIKSYDEIWDQIDNSNAQVPVGLYYFYINRYFDAPYSAGPYSIEIR
jgi:hypothetical protein